MMEFWLFFLSCFWDPQKSLNFWILDLRKCLKKLGLEPGLYAKVSCIYCPPRFGQNSKVAVVAKPSFITTCLPSFRKLLTPLWPIKDPDALVFFWLSPVVLKMSSNDLRTRAREKEPENPGHSTPAHICRQNHAQSLKKKKKKKNTHPQKKKKKTIQTHPCSSWKKK